MNKLLHEKLRNQCAIKQRCIVADSDRLVPFVNWDGMIALADEIEKYYIPRPRFEDGEPVQLGDRFYSEYSRSIETVSSMKFTPGGFKLNGGIRYDYGEPVRRCLPEPKVLDADGVEIKVGDTVWLTTSGKKLRVDGFTPWKYVRCSNPEIDGDHEAGLNFAPESLTHREPDSLEKLRDDIQSHVTSGWHISTSQAAIYANRLTTIMERDA